MFRWRGTHAANPVGPGCAGADGTSLKRTAAFGGVRRFACERTAASGGVRLPQAVASDFAFFLGFSAFCVMKRSVFVWASLSTICTGGDFIR